MSALEALIVAEIDETGPLPFSRYMELALYHPEHGFYVDGGAGRRRDFITSAEVGPLFGAVLARAIDSWWDDLGRPDPFLFVEAGAGPGTLARSILRSELRCREVLRYIAVETSAAQRDSHPDSVISTDSMPEDVEVGVIFANELLDNLPFDMEEWDPDAERWFEIRVGHDGDRLVEVVVPTADAFCETGGHRPIHAHGRVRTPVHRSARAWWESAVASLGAGWVVAIDYGEPERTVPAHPDWLRTYSEHGRAGSALDQPGTKDITTDVCWAQLTDGAGGTPNDACSFEPQADWLRSHGIEQLVDAGREYWAGHAAAPDLRAIEMRSRSTEAGALLDPAGLGGFSVAVQQVGMGRA